MKSEFPKVLWRFTSGTVFPYQVDTLKHFVSRNWPFHWYRPLYILWPVRINLSVLHLLLMKEANPLACHTDPAVHNGDGTGSAVVVVGITLGPDMGEATCILVHTLCSEDLISPQKHVYHALFISKLKVMHTTVKNFMHRCIMEIPSMISSLL